MMTLEEVRKTYVQAENGPFDYFINEYEMSVGDTAYGFYYMEDELQELEIVDVIARSDDPEAYDAMGEEVLWEREAELNADTSCELVTDNDQYLIWFKCKKEEC